MVKRFAQAARQSQIIFVPGGFSGGDEPDGSGKFITAHSRIYDRLLSMCVPVRFTGDNFRQETAKRKMESMKKLITD